VTVGVWQERPTSKAGLLGVEVGSRFAGESAQNPKFIVIFLRILLRIQWKTRKPAEAASTPEGDHTPRIRVLSTAKYKISCPLNL